MTPMLRPYQAEAVSAIRERYVAGDRATLLVLPTGTGKTVVFAELARRTVDRGGRVLVLAHRGELLEQAASKLVAVGVRARIEQAERRGGDADAVVASVQTLRGDRLAAWPADAFRLVVVDEAHHATAAGYRAILDHFAAARVLGVTATPDRLDGAALGEVFASAAYRYDLAQAIRDGWLARIEARRVRLAVNLDDVHTRAGDLDLGELELLYGSEAAIDAVVNPLTELAGGLRTILFAVSVAHAEALAAAINLRQPGAAQAVSGETAAGERADLVERFRRGELRVLVNCSLYTEGFDCPEVECVAIARPTKSRALYAQMIGRGTRLAPGKERVLVLDFVGNTRRHRLVTPAAILAGADVSADALAAAEDSDGDVLAALDEAVSEEAKAERRATEPRRIRFWADAVDVFGVQPGSDVGDGATERQRSVLEDAGLDVPADLSRRAASKLIEAIAVRREKGLATFKQVRLLSRFGVDAREMPFATATTEIGRFLAKPKGRRGGGRRRAA